MLPIRGLKVRIADTLQEWSEALKNLKTPNSFRQYVDDLFERVKPELFMPKTGGTFTGPVFMAGKAENDISPTTLAQVRELIQAIPPTDLSPLMPKAGGTFTGKVTLSGNASADLEPVALQQMQAAIAAIPPPVATDVSGLMPKAGGTFTGDVVLAADANAPMEPTTLQQVTALVAGVKPADLSGLMYKSGGTFTGDVTMAGNATQPLQPTTLQQMQAAIAAIPATDTSTLMPKAGGTFTGAVNLAANAANPLEPVSLQQLQALLAALPAVPTSYPFDMNFSSGGQVLPGDFINVFIAQRQITIPQSLVKCSARAIGAAGTKSDSEIGLLVNGTKVLTITFAKNSQDGVLALTTAGQDIVIPVSAVVSVQAHATNYDTTLSYPVIAITGTTPTA